MCRRRESSAVSRCAWQRQGPPDRDDPGRGAERFEAVLAPLNYRGPCVIDYKLADGRVQIFEINPRLGGTLLLKSNAGQLRQALGHILAAAR
jgi:carbamoylphosphate synthase large subunit